MCSDDEMVKMDIKYMTDQDQIKNSSGKAIRSGVFLLSLITCFVCRGNEVNQKTFHTNQIFCTYLLNENTGGSNKIEIYKGFQDDVKDPEKFIRKYGNQNFDFDDYLKREWLDSISFSNVCDNLTQCNISESDFDYKKFKSDIKVIRVSDFYFFNNNKGFFIASTVCGESREVADIYLFEINENNSVSVKFLSF